MVVRSAFVLCLACLGAAHGSKAQNPEVQAWGDFTLGRTFAANWLAELEVGYQQLVQGTPSWSCVSITPTLEVSTSPHIDIISGFPWMDTQQTDEVRTREFRAQLGARIHVLPFRKLQPRITWRYEWRHFNTIAPEEQVGTSQSNRTRVNAAFFYAIDKPLMSHDTLWYTWVDWEAFVVLDQQLQERYAHLSIGRIGLGRKFNYNWRAEIVYALWHARDEVDVLRTDQYLDHVFRVSLKYYITPPNRRKPEPAPGE
ncbi:MAG: DUF2490 domain-containing protein [Flavobacteriales bacterium]|nr:DUF2490 domain-containing protein [Flavobacteriales bacterium]